MSIYSVIGKYHRIKNKLEECNYDKKYEDYIYYSNDSKNNRVILK